MQKRVEKEQGIRVSLSRPESKSRNDASSIAQPGKEAASRSVEAMKSSLGGHYRKYADTPPPTRWISVPVTHALPFHQLFAPASAGQNYGPKEKRHENPNFRVFRSFRVSYIGRVR